MCDPHISINFHVIKLLVVDEILRQTTSPNKFQSLVKVVIRTDKNEFIINDVYPAIISKQASKLIFISIKNNMLTVRYLLACNHNWLK